MTYATIQNLIDRYGTQLLVRVTDRGDVPTGAIVEDVAARQLETADAVIDGYLAGRYVLPLAEVPPVLVPIAEAIAIYKLHPYSPEQKITDEYKDAIADLVRMSSGVIRLPIAGIEPAGSGGGGVETTDRERDFTPENLRGFI